MNELLPNQTHKVAYQERTDKKCSGRIQYGDDQTIESRLDRLPILEWFEQTADPTTERLAIIQQVDSFTDSYFDFSLDIACKETYRFSRRIAFLVNTDGPIRLRPLQFVTQGFQPSQRTTILVQDAEPNDRLVVLTFVQNIDDPGRFDRAFENYEFRFTPSGALPVQSTTKENDK